MKRHLEPLAIAANVTQAAFCRLDTVLLTFGFLVMRYERMLDEGDYIASRSIISSLEKRWMAANQDIFIAAVIVNPFFRGAPFGRHPRFVVAGIIELLGRLYLRFFLEVAPQMFSAELRDYLTEEGQYTELRATCNRHKTSAKQQVRFTIVSSSRPETNEFIGTTTRSPRGLSRPQLLLRTTHSISPPCRSSPFGLCQLGNM